VTAPTRLDVAFPYTVDGRGRTADSGYDDHVRDMIELLLFTSAGERVMRPDFGCGLGDLVFEPNSPEMAASLLITIEAALQRWLGDVIDVAAVEADSDDSTLRIRIAYVVRATGSRRDDVFTGGAP
jgi:phage baseplate assembly protein W